VLNREFVREKSNGGERWRKTLRGSTPQRRERMTKQELGEEESPSGARRSPRNSAGESGLGDGRRRRSSEHKEHRIL
jgi:hypothetical protein